MNKGGRYIKETPDSEPVLVEQTQERTECIPNQSDKYAPEAADDDTDIEGIE